jgi:hypothetical protein
MSNVPAVVGTVSTALLWASAATACPNCPTARLARAQICDAHFGTNLVATLAPLAILLGVAVLLRRLGRPRGRAP